MALKKPAPASKPVAAAPAAKAPIVSSTPVRNTPIPKTLTPTGASGIKKTITHADIAKRAYEIWRSGKGGSEMENWLRAERELKA
jgi:hypothetical protein